MSDLSDVIESLGAAAYTVTRRGAVTAPGGIASEAASSTLSVRAIAWTLSGYELQRRLEGRTGIELRALLTKTAVFIPEDAAGGAGGGDVVTIDGLAYEVERVEKWSQFGTYFMAVCRRVL